MSQIDKHIKEKIYHHESKVDPEEIWKNILPEVQPVIAHHKSDNAKYIGLSVLLLFLLGSFSWYSLSGSFTNEQLGELNELSISTNQEAKLAYSSASTTSLTSEAKTKSVNEESLALINEESKTIQTAQSSASLLKANTQSILKQSVSQSNTLLGEKLGKNTIVTTSNKASGEANAYNYISQTKSKISTDNTAIQLVEQPAYHSMTTSVEGASILEKAKPSSLSPENQEAIEKEITAGEVEKIDALDFAALGEDFVPKFSKFKPSSYSEDKFQLGFGIYGGYNQDVRKLSPKAGFDELDNYIVQRNSTETSLESINAGFEALVRHRSGLQLRTGLSYTYIAERLDVGYSITETAIIPDGIIEVLIDVNGDTTYVRGAVPVQLTTEYSRQTFNYHRMWDVPVILGYRFSGTDDWNFGLEAGIHANIQTTQKGEILATTGAITDLATSPNTFKDNVGMSLYFGLTAEYGLGENWQLTFSPFYRNFPNSFSSNDYEVNQHYSMWGANLGIRYLFIPYRKGGKTGCPTF